MLPSLTSPTRDTAPSGAAPVQTPDAPLAPIATDADSARSQRFSRLIAAAVLLTAVCAMTGNRTDTDLWGHVVYGREVLRDHELPETTTWSYVTRNYRWINHENLAEILLAVTVDAVGPIGLTLGKLALAMVIVGCLIWTSRSRGAGWLATAIVVIVAADTTEFHWHFRPQALTYTCFAVMLAGLSWVFRDWQGEWRSWREMLRGTPVTPPAAALRRLPGLFALPVLFVLWTNSHGGFVAGAAVLVAYLGLRMFEAWAWWGRAGLRPIFELAAYGVFAGAATLLNPYGGELHAWLIYDIGPARPEISDWQPINVLTDPEAGGLWMLLAIAAIGLGLSQRRKSLTELVILGILLWQGVSHVRNLVFFALACGCWLAPYLDDVIQRLASGLRARLNVVRSAGSELESQRRWQRIGTALLVLWMTGVSVALVPRLTQIAVRRDWYPVSAMQYVRDHGLSGRFLVDFNWAQYAIMCFAEGSLEDRQSRVAVDGRLRTCYPWELLDVFLDFYLPNGGPEVRNRSPLAPAFSPDRALDIGSPDLVLLWREREHSVQVMERKHSEWVLLYQDQLAQLWGRRTRYDAPGSADYIPPEQRQVTDDPQIGSVPWPALPRETVTGAPPERLASR